MNKLGLLGKIARVIWAVKGIVSIVLLLGTFLGYMTSEMIEQRRTMLRDFSVAVLAVTEAENAFRLAGETAFKGPSRTGQSISTDQILALEVAVRNLRSALLEALAPNGSIENNRTAYVGSLTDLQGKLNLFEPGADGTESILRSLVAVQAPADAYHEAATEFQTSVWTSFWASF